MTKEKVIPRLCGGTFFTLLLPARQNTKKSQNFLFKELMSIYDPTVSGIYLDSFKTPASQFKNCNQTYRSDYIKIGDPATQRAFENRFENDYESLLMEAEKLCDDYLTRGRSSRSDIFVRDVLEVIMLDNSIPDDTEFHIGNNGAVITKENLSETPFLYLPSFVLGIWYYICTERTDNAVGEKTIIAWNEKPFMGTRGLFPKLKVNYEKIEADKSGNPEVIPYVTDDDDVIGNLGEMDLENAVGVRHVGYKRVSELQSTSHVYIEKAKEAFRKSKSFFYPNEEREFYEFYVCNDLVPRKNIIYYDGSSHMHNPEKVIKNVTARRLVVDHGRFTVIVGTGGLGKSMMMRHLMLDALKTYSEDNKVLPAFVILKDYNPEKASLLEYIFSQIEQYNWNMELSDLTEMMKQGNVLLLLDGLDEIKAKYRDKFDDELNKLSEKYQTCAYVLSSRPIGSFGEFKHFKVYNLQPFTKKQAIEAIQKLDFRIYDESIKQDFIKDLDKRLYYEKKEFAGNPLLLTIMLITFEQYHTIPTQKFLFYEQAYEALTQKHDATKALTREYATGLDPYAFKQYFSEFCINTYHEEQYKFSREQLEQAFQLVITLNKLNTTPSAFITDATDKICLLYRDGDSYYFCHRSFQEYFAAYFCSRQIEDRFYFIREMFNDKDSSAFDDETLEMLYGMDEQKTERQIIVPFLEELFKTGDDYKDYINFLRRMYPEIVFEKGDVDGWSETECQSAQYYFIANQYGFKEEIDGEEIDVDYDRAAEIFAYIDNNWDDPEGRAPERKLVNIDDIPTGYKSHIEDYDFEDEDSIEYVGMRVKIQISFIYGDSKYTRLYQKDRDIVEDENFPLHREFMAAKETLAMLKEKYRQKRNSNWITNFH